MKKKNYICQLVSGTALLLASFTMTSCGSRPFKDVADISNELTEKQLKFLDETDITDRRELGEELEEMENAYRGKLTKAVEKLDRKTFSTEIRKETGLKKKSPFQAYIRDREDDVYLKVYADVSANGDFTSENDLAVIAFAGSTPVWTFELVTRGEENMQAFFYLRFQPPLTDVIGEVTKFVIDTKDSHDYEKAKEKQDEMEDAFKERVRDAFNKS